MGTIVIGPGGGQNRTVVPGLAEVAEMNYTVVFSGPGGTRTEHFGPAGGTIQLVLGTYRVSVRAVNDAGRLRGLTEQSITIAGNETHNIVLDAVIGVKNFDQLKAALTSTAEPSGGSGPFTDPAHPRNIIVLENDITMTAQIMLGSGSYTLVAEPEKTVTLTSGFSPGSCLIDVPGSGRDLILGSAAAGLTGNIVIDGAGSAAMLITAQGGLTVNPGVTLKNGTAAWGVQVNTAHASMPGINQGWDTADFGANQTVTYMFFSADDLPAVLHNYLLSSTPGNYAVAVEGIQHTSSANINVSSNVKISLRGSGTLTTTATIGMFVINGSGSKLALRGPKLAGNISSTNNVISVGGSGELEMWDGEISGNTNSSASTNGGGVRLNGGTTFVMHGGTISGNKATDSTNRGGGVYVASGAVFSKKGGTIYGIDASDPGLQNFAGASSYPGHAVYAAGTSNYRNTTAGPGVRLYIDAAGPTDPDDSFNTFGNWDQ